MTNTKKNLNKKYENNKIENNIDYNKVIDTTNNMSNSKQWYDFLHQLHNICRDFKASPLTGMDALNEMLNILFLFFFEQKGILDKHQFPKYCKFSYIYKKYCTDSHIENDDENENKGLDEKEQTKFLKRIKLWHLLWDEKNEKCVFKTILQEHNEIGKFLRMKVSQITKYQRPEYSKVIQLLFNKIHKELSNVKFDSFEYDAFGDAYEKFKSKEGNTGGNMGQYFTNPQVVDMINEEIELCEDDIYYDPACGSGGFLRKSARSNIVKRSNIYGNDPAEMVFKALAFNCILMDIPLQNIQRLDSLSKTNIKSKTNFFTKIGTNPPFGCSFDIIWNDYWGVLKTGKNTIKDSSALFVQHMYMSLKKGGKCGTVIARSILHNGTTDNAWEKRFRKYLLEKCNIYKIVHLPKGIFKETNFATSVIFFIKGEPTKEVRFEEGWFKDDQKGIGDKKMETPRHIKTLTIKEIIEKDYSLKLDDYKEEKEICRKIKEYKELGNVCLFKNGKQLKKSNFKEGNIPVIGGGKQPVGYHSGHNHDENTILCSSSGAYSGFISRYNTKVWASDCFSIKSKDKNLLSEDYLYEFLKLNQISIYSCQTGSAQPHVYSKNISNIKIPIPSIEKQNEIVNFMKDKRLKYDIEKTIKLFGKFNIFDILLKERYDLFERILYLQNEITRNGELIANYKKRKQWEIEQLFESYPHKKYNLVDICKINRDNISKKDKDTLEFINYIDISSVKKGVIKGTKNILIDKIPSRAKRKLLIDDILLSCVRPKLHHIAIIKNNIENGVCSTGFCTLTCNKKLVLPEFLFYNLFTEFVTNYLVNNTNSDSPPAVNIKTVEKTKIRLPNLENQNKILLDMKKLDNQDNHYNRLIKLHEEDNERIYKNVETMCKIVQMEELSENEEKVEEVEPVMAKITKTKSKIKKKSKKEDNVISNDNSNYTKEELLKKLNKDLKEICKKLGKKGYSKLKKDDLVNKILN